MDVPGLGFGAPPPPPSPHATGLHPLALALGVIGVLVLVVIVAASSYQRDKLQHMARKMLRKKRASFSESSKIRASACGCPVSLCIVC